jgi:hypothetical protein
MLKRAFGYVLPLMIMVLYSTILSAQKVKLYSSPRAIDVVNQFGDTLANPWSGGLVDPQPYNIDLNGDGKKDLVIFNAGVIDNRLHTYLYIGEGQYRYAPEYESFFPPMTHWMLLADYNGDGKEDIFTYSSLQAGMDVYKNISTGNTPKFQLMARQLEFPLDNFYSNIYVSPGDIPAIVDVDGDSDLDILTFDAAESRINWYKNLSHDKYGKLDSLDFKLITLCWGKCSTTFDPNIPIGLGAGCGADIGKRGHGNSTLLAWDLDGDGDMDVLYGNVFLNYVSALKNGRIDAATGGFHVDSFISYTTKYPANTTPAIMDIYPAAFRVDVDHDGQDDLLITPQDPLNPLGKDKFFYYQNASKDNVPDFQFKSKNFITDQSMAEGEHSAAAFFDYNGDGLQDLIVVAKADTGFFYNFDKLELYKNIGNSGHAVYKKIDDDLAGVKSMNLNYVYPTTGDINGDGKPDLVLGSTDGNIYYFTNEGIANAGLLTETVKFKLQSSNFQGINVGNYSTPCLADVNKDGLLDMVIGQVNGRFSYYQNTGSKTNPAYTLVTDSFGNVRTNEFYYNYTDYDTNGRPIDSVRMMIPNGRSAPGITDIDHDGKLDMISGSLYGNLIFYLDIEDNLNGTFTRTDTFLYNRLLGRAEKKSFGSLSNLAVADLNNDSIPELLIGNHLGGFYFYGSKEVFYNSIQEKKSAFDFKLYPNPAQTFVTLQFASPLSSQLKMQLADVLGRALQQGNVPLGTTTFHMELNALPRGVYFLQIEDTAGQSAIRKLVIE